MALSLELVEQYRSFAELNDFSIEGLTLLTGPNGSGKSQLLEAMNAGSIVLRKGARKIEQERIRLFTWQTLSAAQSQTADALQFGRSETEAWREVEHFKSRHRATLAAALDSPDETDRLSDDELFALLRSSYLTSQPDDRLEAAEARWADFEAVRADLSREFETHVLSMWEQQLGSRFRDVAKQDGLPLCGVTRARYNSNRHRTVTTSDPFQQDLSHTFAVYSKRMHDNILHRTLDAEQGTSLGGLTDDQFRRRWGPPPWEFVNGILERGHYDFRVTSPPAGKADLPFTAELVSTPTGAHVPFSQMSSGERILLSLAICIYASSDDRVEVDYPEVVLFDEVDAPLHPSMIRDLIDTLQRVLVDERQIDVVLATHSPTTVALADAATIVQVNSRPPRLQSSTRERAVRALSAGVETLSVVVEKRRPVYVESGNDVRYYEKLFQAYESDVEAHFQPVFLSAGTATKAGSVGEGSARVRTVVRDLHNAGVVEVRGLVDGDGRTQTDVPGVHLLGRGSRYSIESFVWDPTLIAGLLNYEQLWNHVTPEAMGLNRGAGVFGGLDAGNSVQLQGVVDSIAAVVFPGSHPRFSATNRSGVEVSLPEPWRSMPGHTLTERIMTALPQLKGLGREREITIRIVDRVIRHEPGLLDRTVLSSIEDLLS